MRHILVKVAVGFALSCATIGGLLAAQGRWNHEGTKHIPLLNALFTAPPEQAEARPVNHGPARPTAEPGRRSSGARPATGMRPTGARPTGVRASGDGATGVRPPGRSAAETGAEIGAEIGAETGEKTREKTRAAARPRAGALATGVRERPPGSLFDLRQLESSGITVAEVNGIVARMRDAKREVAAEHARLRRLREELDARERDVRERQARLDAMLREVGEGRARLDRAIATFNARVVELKVDEEAGLRNTARTIARLTPPAGAELILEFWRTAGGKDKVAKLLAVMEKERADEILACLDTQRMREILEKRMTVVRPGRGPESHR